MYHSKFTVLWVLIGFVFLGVVGCENEEDKRRISKLQDELRRQQEELRKKEQALAELKKKDVLIEKQQQSPNLPKPVSQKSELPSKIAQKRQQNLQEKLAIARYVEELITRQNITTRRILPEAQIPYQDFTANGKIHYIAYNPYYADGMLGSKDGRVSILELKRYLDEKVSAEALKLGGNQTPYTKIEASGDIFLTRK